MLFSEPDPETATWWRYQDKCRSQKLWDITFPNAKMTVPQVQDWIKHFPAMIRTKYREALEKIVPANERTLKIVHWNNQKAEEYINAISNNDNYYCVWDCYERELYLAFRKFVGEKILKKVERTIDSVRIIDKSAGSEGLKGPKGPEGNAAEEIEIELHITSAFSDERRILAKEFFVNQKQASGLTFVVGPIK
jgi:hypothetical protein